MKRKHFIEIPEPCHENWSEMEVVSLGRHCTVCEKKVIDFSRMPDQQVIDILQNSSYQTCGKFSEKQLENGLEKSKENFLPFQLKAAASAIVLLFSSKAFSANSSNTTKVEVNSNFTSKEVYRFTKLERYSPSDTNRRYVKGVILDSITGETFPGAKLFFKGYETIRTFTDLDGNFIVEIPNSLMQDSFILVVHAVSYRINDYEVKLSLKDDLDNIKVLLPSDIRDMQSVPMLGVVYSKKKWWQRKKRK